MKLDIEILHKKLPNKREFSRTRIIYNNIFLKRVNDYLSALSIFVHLFDLNRVEDTLTLIKLGKSVFREIRCHEKLT